MKKITRRVKKKSFFCFWIELNETKSGLIMEAKLEKDADSMVVKPMEYAASEYSASSEPPPVSTSKFHE